ncbi:ABC transporter G family member 23-like isoform X2, partial [Dinothrombium tinctorium]
KSISHLGESKSHSKIGQPDQMKESEIVSKSKITEKLEKAENESRHGNDTANVPIVVHLKNVSFRYKHHMHSTLKNVNLVLPEGFIYGLLGASGCGKTTLLRCILGQLTSYSGSVLVFGLKPGSKQSLVPGPGVGYMPQEISLYSELSIRETLKFYGRLFGMKRMEITSKIRFLINFLNLPATGRLVKDLSDGQKRRVSLAAALINTPPLLVLDEPTVGVDPLLRENIWNHLKELAESHRMTIILTTHYIEETTRADLVGFMREGKLLVEETPHKLMSFYKVQTLEDVFLELSAKPVESNKPIKLVNIEYSRGGRLKNKKIPTFVKINAIIEKGFIRLKRNLVILFFQTLTPIIIMIVFGICIGDQQDSLNIAVYNPEQEILTNETRKLESQTFLSFLPAEKLTLTNYSSKEEAIASVDDGKSLGALIFNPTFSQNAILRFQNLSNYSDDDIYLNSTIDYYYDMSSIIGQLSVNKQLRAATEKYIQKKSKHRLDPMLKVEQAIYGAVDMTFREFITPGIIMAIIYMLSVTLTVLTLVTEKQEGSYHRIKVAGVKVYQVIVAHTIVQFVSLSIQITTLLVTSLIVTRFSHVSKLHLIIPITLLHGLVAMSFGFFISSIYENEREAILTSVAAFYPMLILSGVFWPIEAMSTPLNIIAKFAPMTMPIKAFRSIVVRNVGLTNLEVIAGIGTS